MPGAGTVNNSGQATLVTSSLAAGTHPLTAVFPATDSFATSTSAISTLASSERYRSAVFYTRSLSHPSIPYSL
ncbi:Ig-like domain-containing protein [Edaphobacter paludis]|uniref:Ig-like domain-containing protein n=1 Tax=Edaphobacter paludis TaxID=3035702 RepID=UPI00359F1B26